MFAKNSRKTLAIAVVFFTAILIGGTATEAAASTITVSGIVKDWSGNVITSGVTVTLVGDDAKTATTSITDGSFSLSGVPANTPFSLKFSKAGYLDVYTRDISSAVDMNLNVSATGSSPFNMPTIADLTAFGATPDAGKGLISGRVADQTYRYSSTVGGVFVTATGNGGKAYPVFYRNPFGLLVQGGTTSGNGRYYVLNVDDGDTVTVSAARSGWSFSPRVFTTHASGVSQGRITGTAPGYVAMSGSVITSAGDGIAGAKLELNGDNGKFTNAGGDGSYTFSGLPRDAYFYNKVTAPNCVPTYAGPVYLVGNISGINIPLFTAEEMSGNGVTGSNGMLACKVIDPSMTPLSGATVLLTSKSQASYSVVYSGGGNATNETGNFLVPNILPGDMVTISVTKAGYAFPPAYLDGFTGAVTGKYIWGSTPVAYNSYVAESGNTAGIAGAMIEQVGASPANTTTSSTSPAGAYTLNVPSGVPFYLRFSKTGAGYVDTYTAEMTRTAPFTESLSDGNNLFAATKLTDWNVASGKGIIRARVKDSSENYIAGATVIYTSSKGNTYQVCYNDACDTSLTATQSSSNGRYIIKDVEAGDTVTATATKAGYTFNTRVFHTYAGSVHQGGITGTAASNSVFGSISYGGSQTGSFKLMLWSADMTGSYYQELSLAGGSFTFNNVPNGRYFLSAYRDSNNNSQYTAGEAYGYHQDAGGLQVININGSSVNIGAVTLADPSGTTGVSVSINAAIGGLRGYLVFFRSGDSLKNNSNPVFTLDLDLVPGPHAYPVTQMRHNYEGMPVPAGTYDFYFLTGDLENGPDKGVIQYMQPGVVISKGSVTNIPASGPILFNAGGTVSGTVTSSYSTHPLAGVMVYLSADQAGQIIRAWGRTNANGEFQFDHVPAGTYYLILSYTGYHVFTPITVTVTEDGTFTVPGTSTVITPTQTPATISGNLAPFGAGVDSRILLKQGETVIANVAPDIASGSYSIYDVVPGSYTLIGSARGYMPGQVSVGVTAEQTLTQNFTLGSTKNVIVNGLNWLLAHQQPDGSFDDNLSGDAHQYVFGWTGYTGLTLLAILENPKYNDSGSPDYLGATLLGQIYDALYGVTGAAPKNGIKQYFESTYHAADDPSTPWNDVGAFYNSTVSWASVAATPVALEKLIALGMPLSDPKVTGAVQFLLGAQITAAKASNPIFAGGWRYNPGNTDTDNWETAWVIMALMKAGVNPSVQAVVDGVAHIRRSQITEGGGAGLFAYQPNDTSGYGPLGTSAACVLALNFARAPNSDPDVNRFFQWVKNNGGFSGYDRWADAYWWSMFPWAAILYDDPATSGPVKKYYETLELTWNMAEDVMLRQNSNGSWSNPNYISGGSISGNTVMYTASALMAIAPYAGLTPLPDETTISGTVRNPAGEVLQNAKVEALLDGIVRASTVTNGSGYYTLSVPQNYAYTIRVTAAGYVRKDLTTANVGTSGLTGQDIAYLANDVDTAHPTIADLTPTNGSTVVGGKPVISAVLTDLGSGGNAPSGIDPAAISMKLDGNAVNASYNAATGVVSFIPQYDLSYATHTVTVDVQDYAGNGTQASWSFTNTPAISFTPMVFNVHSSDGYHTYLDVTIGNDFTGTLPDEISAINVTGPGGTVIATKPDFVYYPQWREFLAKLPGQPALGEYRFEVSGLSMTTVITDSQVTNRTIPVPDKSTFNYTNMPGENPTFSWGAVNYTETPLYYRLIINDMAGNRVYSTSRVQGMLSHTVPAGTLQADQSYQFQVRVDDASSGNLLQNESRSDYVTFSLTPISYTGYVADSQSPSQIIAGATVEQGGLQTNSVVTDAAGLYTLGNLKAGLPFYLKIYKDASYAPCYSAEMSYTANRVDPRDRAFTLFPAGRLGPGTGNWNVDVDKGIIRAYVRDKIDGYVGGAVVTATGVLQATYPVCYDDVCTTSLTATKDKDGAGRFVIKNVLDGDTVTVTATKTGWTPYSRVYHTFAGGVSQGRITIQGPVSLALTVTTRGPDWTPIQGALVQVVGFPTVSALTGADGKATLTGLPPNTSIPFSISTEDYVNSYGLFSATGVSTWRVALYTQADLNTWGIREGAGVIYGRAINNADSNIATNGVGGAQLTCTSDQGKVYEVVYLNDDYTVATGAAATLANGRYLVLNVAPGDEVTVSARKEGWSFWSKTAIGYAGGVSIGYIYGNAGGAVISMYVKDKNSAPIAGATVRMAENPSLFATTDSSGKATLTNLPLDTPLTFEVMKTGYANAYSRHVILTGNNSDWGTYYLFPSVNAVWGVLEGKGAVMGWVKKEVDGSTLAGAQVTCTNAQGRKYAVAYLNNDHTINAGAATTSSNGRFLILNVEPGDTVIATAHLAGWTFQPRAYTARANAVNQSNINGWQYKYQGTALLLHGMAPANFLASLRVDDPLAAIGSITVTGPGIVSPLSLTYDSQKQSWQNEAAISFGTMPSLPLTYTLVITEKDIVTPLKQYLYVSSTTGVQGDVSGDGAVNLTDAILSLQAIAGNLPAGAKVYMDADVDDDNRIGMPEAIYILQEVSGLR